MCIFAGQFLANSQPIDSKACIQIKGLCFKKNQELYIPIQNIEIYQRALIVSL